ncbi:MAG: DNA methyltransferase [Zavarzinella sp.]
MSQFKKFQKLLEELFQLDQADLDFGIYRIMNQKRDEVVRFLEKDLLPQVKEAFKHYQSADKVQIQRELDKLIQQIEGAGMNPNDSPKVQALKAQMADSSVDVTALENEVFSHLFNFFRRYYHEGDFISLRRYKEGVYAIPYEGEEVKLHWANHDQYYVKSSEYFRDYIFTIPSGKRVRVHLVAASSEQDNKKEAPGKERRFIICAEDPIYEENGELFIRFEYKPDDGKKKQDTLNQEAIERVLKTEGIDDWVRELGKLAPTKANPNRTVLEKHLTQYTARNTFDYFIHKDLGGFLRRELDFYIKNEVMHLDDIEHDTVPRVEQYLSKIKVIRKIAHKVIQFLEQLENFQKKLWLKKKFVVETNYCITLDRVPEELYPEIAANEAQREEWVRLFAIDKIETDLNGPGFSVPLTVDFLKAHPGLFVDTQYFDLKFQSRLLRTIENLEQSSGGLVIESEASQALRLIKCYLAHRVGVVVADPPYNTGNDGFPYKDAYQHSSWLTMTSCVLEMLNRAMRADSLCACFIDDHEIYRLGNLMNDIFGETGRAACAPWKSEASGGKEKTGLRSGHEYVLIYHNGDATCIAQTELSTGELDREDKWGKYRKGRELRKWGGASSRLDRPGQWFQLPTPDGTLVYPIKNDGSEGHWRWGKNNAAIKVALNDPDVFHWERCDFNAGVSHDGASERWVPFEKIRDVKKSVGWSTWLDNIGRTADATRELKSMFGEKPFDTPKPMSIYRWLIALHNDEEAYVVDLFAGSGTAGHATIDLNASDDSNRKFVLSDIGDSVRSVIWPRIQKAFYADSWKDGVPSERGGRRSALFKIIRLESYEDTLNNLELKRTGQQTSLLEQDDDLREQYVLSYMLDVESRGSQSLLNVESFRNPDQYKLRVERNGETQLVNVDLVETFNWLLGLTVKHIDVIRGVRVVEGTNPNGDRALVLWRNLDETNNDALDEWFKKQDYNTKDQEYDLIYVNGDNNLENLRRGDQTWKVRLIEEEFGRLMFDVEDV